MAHAAYVSADRTMIVCEHPSEPIVAAAAAVFWKRHLPRASRALFHHAEQLQVEAGNVGDFVAQLVLLLGFDVLNNLEDGKIDEKTLTRPWTVQRLLDSPCRVCECAAS